MKQHTTVKQLNELSEKGLKKIAKWAKEKLDVKCSNQLWTKGVKAPRLSIGQMIEFLEPHKPRIDYSQGELCDALWEAVKEVLET